MVWIHNRNDKLCSWTIRNSLWSLPTTRIPLKLPIGLQQTECMCMLLVPSKHHDNCTLTMSILHGCCTCRLALNKLLGFAANINFYYDLVHRVYYCGLLEVGTSLFTECNEVIKSWRLNGLAWLSTLALISELMLCACRYHTVDLAKVSIFTADEFAGVMLQLYFGKPIKR